jgi:hypothetical protein
LPVPSEQRVRPDDRRDLTQGLPAQPVGARAKLPPVVIGEPEAPPAKLPPQTRFCSIRYASTSRSRWSSQLVTVSSNIWTVETSITSRS